MKNVTLAARCPTCKEFWTVGEIKWYADRAEEYVADNLLFCTSKCKQAYLADRVEVAK